MAKIYFAKGADMTPQMLCLMTRWLRVIKKTTISTTFKTKSVHNNQTGNVVVLLGDGGGVVGGTLGGC